jgi:hypothetical protein
MLCVPQVPSTYGNSTSCGKIRCINDSGDGCVNNSAVSSISGTAVGHMYTCPT